MEVTQVGIFMVVNAEHPWKQLLGSVEMVLGSEIERRLVQPEKASSWISLIVDGTVKVISFVHPENII